MLRGSGIKWDLRKAQPYDAYDLVSISFVLFVDGLKFCFFVIYRFADSDNDRFYFFLLQNVS